MPPSAQLWLFQQAHITRGGIVRTLRSACRPSFHRWSRRALPQACRLVSGRAIYCSRTIRIRHCWAAGLCVAGWLADKIGRRLAFVVTLIEGAIFMTLWVYTENHILLWAFGLAWSFGFLGFWGPSTTLTAEVFPTRIRGAANGVVWSPLTSPWRFCSRSPSSHRHHLSLSSM